MNDDTPQEIHPLGKVERTPTGFEIIRFKDRYDTPCSLQMSSLAECMQPGISAVWLGTDDAQPKIMAKHAAMFGVETDRTTGWVEYPLPVEVSLTTRMHISREQVPALIQALQRWLDTGSFSEDGPKDPWQP